MVARAPQNHDKTACCVRFFVVWVPLPIVWVYIVYQLLNRLCKVLMNDCLMNETIDSYYCTDCSNDLIYCCIDSEVSKNHNNDSSDTEICPCVTCCIHINKLLANKCHVPFGVCVNKE